MSDEKDSTRDPLDSAEIVDGFRTTWSLFTAIDREDDEAKLAIRLPNRKVRPLKARRYLLERTVLEKERRIACL